ncbi:hypothetical protein Tco_0923185 [Tanacetum coccineum]|uniref:Uncharacterized protein n=1 Tax=Tanacetum coccineum TaxID=301880 RepID=A0ABQ5D0B4_9ASTR
MEATRDTRLTIPGLPLDIDKVEFQIRFDTWCCNTVASGRLIDWHPSKMKDFFRKGRVSTEDGPAKEGERSTIKSLSLSHDYWLGSSQTNLEFPRLEARKPRTSRNEDVEAVVA